jgi:hypothetical protein
MDYLTKYQKYKLKYKQQKNQLGGTFTYQYEDGWSPEFKTYTRWTDYTSEESRLIREHSDQSQLTLPSGVKIDKLMMQQIGRSNTRRIRIKPEDDQANRILNMLQRFPIILTKDPSDEMVLQAELFRLFTDPNNEHAFYELNQGDWPDAYASRNVSLYRAIIRLGKKIQNINLQDIMEVIESEHRRQAEIERQMKDFIDKNTKR